MNITDRMDPAQCLYCHALMKSLCVPCQFKVHMMHSSPMEAIACHSPTEHHPPCSPKSNPETGHQDCKNCDYYVEIISKLTADVCEDDLVKVVMSSITDSLPCRNQRAMQNKKPAYGIFTNAVAPFLHRQTVCSANAERRLPSFLKKEANPETIDNTNKVDLSSSPETNTPQVMNIVPNSETPSKNTSIVNSSKTGNDDRSCKRQSLEKLKPVPNSDCETESFRQLVQSTNKWQDVQIDNGECKEEVHGSSLKGKTQTPNLSTRSIKNRSLDNEKVEPGGNPNNCSIKTPLQEGEVLSSSLKEQAQNQAQYSNNRNTKIRSSADGNVEKEENPNNRSSIHKNPCFDREYLVDGDNSSLKGKERDQRKYVCSRSIKNRSLADENGEYKEIPNTNASNLKNPSQGRGYMINVYSSSLKEKDQNPMKYASIKTIKKRSSADEHEDSTRTKQRPSNYKDEYPGEYVGESCMKGNEQKPFSSNRTGKKRSLAEENAELEESNNSRPPKGVINNLCSESDKGSRRKSYIEENDERDEIMERRFERFCKGKVKSSTSSGCSKSPSPCSRHSSPARSTHQEYNYPVTVSFRSRSCCNVDGESYDELISFNPVPNAKKTRASETRHSKSGERRFVYRTNSDGQFKSMAIGMSGEDSESDSEGNILIVQRKPSSRCCSPSTMGNSKQVSGLVDASTQYEREEPVNSYGSVQRGVTGLWIVSENVENASQTRANKVKSEKPPIGKSSPSAKTTLKENSAGGRKGSARPKTAGKRIGAEKPTNPSKSKPGYNKTQIFRQPEWQK